jgi:hypothetical protein
MVNRPDLPSDVNGTLPDSRRGAKFVAPLREHPITGYFVQDGDMASPQNHGPNAISNMLPIQAPVSDEAAWPFRVLEQLLQPNANNITTDNANISYNNYAVIGDNPSFDATSATLEELERCFGLRPDVQEPVTDPSATYGHTHVVSEYSGDYRSGEVCSDATLPVPGETQAHVGHETAFDTVQGSLLQQPHGDMLTNKSWDDAIIGGNDFLYQ